MKLRLSEQQLHQQVRYFGYYQLVAGSVASFFAIGVLILAATQIPQLLAFISLFYVSYLALSGFEIYCGYLTLRQPRRGLKLSRISLLSQFIGLAIGGYGIRFFVGLYAELTVNLSNGFNVSTGAGLGSSSLDLGRSPDAIFVSVNLVALLLFVRTTQWLNEWNYHYVSPASSAPATAREPHG